MLKSNNVNELFLGIDGGGSKTKAIIMNESNEVLGSGVAGPGNPMHGFEQATNAITQSASLALIDANLSHINLDELTAGVGLAGVNLPSLFDKMQTWQHPFKQMYLTTDLHIACLGAHQKEDGAVIISGTGSCGFSYIDNQAYIIGGHGFPQGDNGSGAWFGLKGVEHVLLSLDGLIDMSIMNSLLLMKLDCKNSTDLVEVIASKDATCFAQLAHIVFDAGEKGDKVAITIIKEGAEYIDNLARTLWKKKPSRLSIIGGLTASIEPWLSNEVKTWLSLPLSAPEVGAVLFARSEKLKKSNNINSKKKYSSKFC